MKKSTLYGIVILTDSRYVAPKELNDYKRNVLLEDHLIKEALEKLGYKVWRTNWDNADFDWSQTEMVLFRTTWDYFDRFDEFFNWLTIVKTKTRLINSYNLIHWNIDKHYLADLKMKDIPIVDTYFIEKGEQRTLANILKECDWEDTILKPAIAGAARHTYKLNNSNIEDHESIFQQLIKSEALLLQPFQKSILTKGEVSLMAFGGKFSHAILKIAKPGDFRVQDDFGGSVHNYKANKKEIAFCEKVIQACPELPIYARVDAMWDDNDELCVSEVEMIEPELWMRNYEPAAMAFAKALKKSIR